MIVSSLSPVPSYRLHKARNLAVVTLSGKDYYLGQYGSPESREAYQQLIGRWMACGRQLPVASVDLTVNQIMLAYVRYAETHYQGTLGQPSRELPAMRFAFRPLKTLFGDTPAAAFGPKNLKAVREAMVEAKLARTTVNKRVGYIKRLFKWACSEELLPSSVFEGLRTVDGLRRGQSSAKETVMVAPVPDAHVDAVLPFLPPTLRAMLTLQRLTGMRSGEMVRMRACDLEMTGPIWVYRPEHHKTAKHLNKNQCQNGLARVAGSVAFTAVARTVLYFGHHPREAHHRMLVTGKSNIGSSAPSGLVYRIETVEVPGAGSQPRIVFVGPAIPIFTGHSPALPQLSREDAGCDFRGRR